MEQGGGWHIPKPGFNTNVVEEDKTVPPQGAQQHGGRNHG